MNPLIVAVTSLGFGGLAWELCVFSDLLLGEKSPRTVRKATSQRACIEMKREIDFERASYGQAAQNGRMKSRVVADQADPLSRNGRLSGSRQ
jgi:hypothetical protein